MSKQLVSETQKHLQYLQNFMISRFTSLNFIDKKQTGWETCAARTGKFPTNEPVSTVCFQIVRKEIPRDIIQDPLANGQNEASPRKLIKLTLSVWNNPSRNQLASSRPGQKKKTLFFQLCLPE